MAGRMNMAMLMIMVVASLQLQASMAQTRHIVGDSNGWSVPSTASFYSTWASSQTFTVGDILEFRFASGAHTAASVTKEAYDSCNVNNPPMLQTRGPANYTLNGAGPFYLICTIGNHCSLGQKLTVNIAAAGSSPTTPTSSPPPPPPSSASRTALETSSLILIFVAVALLG